MKFIMILAFIATLAVVIYTDGSDGAQSEAQIQNSRELAKLEKKIEQMRERERSKEADRRRRRIPDPMVESEMILTDVLNDNDVDHSESWIDPSSLKVGKTYVLDRRTPIMPRYKSGSLKEMRYATSGQSIKILKRQDVDDTLWYRVKSGKRRGWVNSVALYGQALSLPKKR